MEDTPAPRKRSQKKTIGQIQCARTGKKADVKENKDGSPSYPKGWKQIEGLWYSPRAVKGIRRVRAVHWPVASVQVLGHAGKRLGPLVDAKQAAKGRTNRKKVDKGKGQAIEPETIDKNWEWVLFRKHLNHGYRISTQIMNFALAEYYARDVCRWKTTEKLMPKWDPPYLYPEARALWPDISSKVTVSALQFAMNIYKRHRYAIKWTFSERTVQKKYPSAVIIPKDSYQLSIEDERLAVTFSLGSQNAEEDDLKPTVFRVILRGGERFWRQNRDFQHMLEHPDEIGELRLERRKASSGDHRSVESRHAGKRNRENRKWETRVTLVSRFPFQEVERDPTAVMVVRTCRDALVELCNEKEERILVWHWDQLKRWIREHHRKLHNFSDDTKAEMRPDAPFHARRRDMCDRFDRRMDTAVQTISTQIVGHIARRKGGAVVYDDKYRDESVTGFRYEVLRRLVSEKLSAAVTWRYEGPDADPRGKQQETEEKEEDLEEAPEEQDGTEEQDSTE